MAILTILQYPDKRLHTIAKPVPTVTPEIRQLVQDLTETMYAAPGIGLAATQVDKHLQVIVLDISTTQDQLQVFINPQIIVSSGESECEEGCLSVPDVYEKVRRAEQITVRALNEQGKVFILEAQGMLATCIQHEVDHLKGRVFVEYLSTLKQTRLKAKIKKQLRQLA